MATNYPIRNCRYCNKSFQTTTNGLQPFCSIPCRFWSKVRITTLNDCWEWQGTNPGWGYGRFRPIHGETMKQAHRIVWELIKGKIPKDLFVLHHCDNPPCVNPHHLFLGTHQENIDDMVKKGRSGMRGEKHHSAKLTAPQILEIRKKLQDGVNYKIISKEYNICTSYVYDIKNNKKWKHI